MTRFEYKVFGTEARTLEAELNVYGKDGWECIGVIEVGPSMVRSIMRRPSSDQPDKMLGVN